jgi:hypothetical protein
MNRRRWKLSFAALAFGLTILASNPLFSAQVKGNPGACRLNSDHDDIKHVIFLIFDNVHFLRDKANVPSDLEQMPNLLNFIRGNGTLLTNDHTVLISHTANGILTNKGGGICAGNGPARPDLATRGPGEADYVQQLKNYDEAFGKFFARLAAHGINKSNALFVFTVEECDHFVGSKPTNPGCTASTCRAPIASLAKSTVT